MRTSVGSRLAPASAVDASTSGTGGALVWIIAAMGRPAIGATLTATTFV